MKFIGLITAFCFYSELLNAQSFFKDSNIVYSFGYISDLPVIILELNEPRGFKPEDKIGFMIIAPANVKNRADYYYDKFERNYLIKVDTVISEISLPLDSLSKAVIMSQGIDYFTISNMNILLNQYDKREMTIKARKTFN